MELWNPEARELFENSQIYKQTYMALANYCIRVIQKHWLIP